MDYITANSQANADAAKDKMYYNYLMNYANNDEKLVGDGTNHYFLSDLQEMTESQVIALKAYGKCCGEIVHDKGLTDSYTKSFIADNDPSLWIICPDPGADIMNGVINTTKLPKDDAWWSQENP